MELFKTNSLPVPKSIWLTICNCPVGALTVISIKFVGAGINGLGKIGVGKVVLVSVVSEVILTT